MHLVDVFIQSDLQFITLLLVCVFPGIEPTTFATTAVSTGTIKAMRIV